MGDIMWITWAIAAAAGLGLLIALIAVLKLRKLSNKINDLESYIDSVSKSVEVCDDATKGLGQQLGALREAQQQAQQAAPPEPVAESEEAILRASGLLERGVEVEAVAQQCGLPLEEVRLMDAMRRSKLVTLEPESLS